MRIGTQQQYLKSIDNMQQNQTRLAELQEQSSSGKRLQTPSDDPVAAAQLVKLERELAQYEKFEDNINVTQRRLEMEESILDGVYSATTRLKELTIYAGNGTLSSADRETIAQEVDELTEYVAGLMNTQDSLGEFLFAGSKGGTQPYEQLADGTYQYNGDDGQRNIQVGTQLYVASNDSGSYLFESVEGRLQANLTGESVAAGNSFMTIPSASAEYTSDFESIDEEERFKKATKGLGDLTVTVNNDGAGALTYSIADSAGNVVVPATSYNDGDTVEFNGLQFDLAGLPTTGSAEQSELTLSVEPERMNILDVAQNLSNTLRTESGETLTESLALTLDYFEQSGDRVLEATATLGTRLSSIEQITSTNDDFKLFTQTAISQLEDADLAEVLSLYALEETTMQASQAVFGRVSQLSLFDYIN
jgi:flagellar hook-associated protein 3 FlgL